MNNVKVLVYPIGQAPVVQEIKGSDNLKDMQSIVGGWIEAVNLGALTLNHQLDKYSLYCNEEGKLQGLPLNRQLQHDVVVGQFFVTKHSGGETISLTDEDIELITRLVSEAEIN